MFPPCPYLWALGLQVLSKKVLLSSQQVLYPLREQKMRKKGYSKENLQHTSTAFAHQSFRINLSRFIVLMHLSKVQD